MMLKKLCSDEDVPDENDESPSGQIADVLSKLSDEQIQRLLIDIDNKDLALAMKGWCGKARRRIFENMSERLAVMLIEDMKCMGSVRKVDGDEASEKILRIIKSKQQDVYIP